MATGQMSKNNIKRPFLARDLPIDPHNHVGTKLLHLDIVLEINSKIFANNLNFSGLQYNLTISFN